MKAPTPASMRRFRARLGMTLDQIAEALPCHRQTWHRWETGDRDPPPFLWRALEHLERELAAGRD